MGNSLQGKPSADKVRVFANNDVWLEANAVAQLHTTAQLPHIHAAVGLPDLHAGRGYPIGAAFFSVGHLYPALVGGDIGCGMALWRTGLKAHKTSPARLEKLLGSQEGPLPQALLAQAQPELAALCHDAALPLPAAQLAGSLGSIGGGNHFAELLACEQLYAAPEGDGPADADAATTATTAVCAALDPKAVYLLVHSGSRGLGGAILRAQVEAHGHAGLAADTPQAQHYLMQHEAALRYARLNREAIAQRFLQALRSDGLPLLDVSHNHVLPATHDGLQGFIHRKGATPADVGPVLIPGSRGDYSYLVQPLPGCAAALNSLAHGAGRKWARSDCMGRLAPRFQASALRKTRLGSTVVCNDKALLYEEAPQAYKAIDSVIASLLEAGLVRLLARFKPLLTYKKGGQPCC
ncbi:RNA ligase RtcB family protein [Vandammella animalimorsus]|uniref:tRNA-splicing ligase RtcB n=1 Tax=Vandammella animalimorsus TaxID=2029117 RepID=A0A2A2AJT1_9BURK|nr:RNA ligase RtcB family protein [Vandammella animalimorsus]PAT38013.1 RNA ligase RtcB family protein [Vandammella animalimorsus]